MRNWIIPFLLGILLISQPTASAADGQIDCTLGRITPATTSKIGIKVWVMRGEVFGKPDLSPNQQLTNPGGDAGGRRDDRGPRGERREGDRGPRRDGGAGGAGGRGGNDRGGNAAGGAPRGDNAGPRRNGPATGGAAAGGAARGPRR